MTTTRAHRAPPERGVRLLLASCSARRRRMLEEAGVPFEAMASAFDDGALAPGAPGAQAPRQWAAAVALLKADGARRALGADRRAGALILGADTIVVKDGAIIGQPRDRDDAERIVRALAEGRHEVITGAALVCAATGRRLVLVDSAQVRVGAIGDEPLHAYLESGDWRGKAGAYNLSERLEAGWPIEYEGDPTTIMGLPMRRLLPILRDALSGAWPAVGGAA